jgi:hypothetical protein
MLSRQFWRAPPNQALDRTAMSAEPSIIADSWPAAALMAVGQLDR